MHDVAEWVAPTGDPNDLEIAWFPTADVTDPTAEIANGRLVVSSKQATLAPSGGGEQRFRASYAPVPRYWYEMIPVRVRTASQARRAVKGLDPRDEYVETEVFTHVCEAFDGGYTAETDIARRLLAMYDTEAAPQTSRELAYEAVREGLVATGKTPVHQNLQWFINDLYDSFDIDDALDERIFRRDEELFKLVVDEAEVVGAVQLPRDQKYAASSGSR